MPLGKEHIMTEAEKLTIRKLRQDGLGYKKIAVVLDLPVNSVKTYLRRHPVAEDAAAVPDICERCGNPTVTVQRDGQLTFKFQTGHEIIA